MSAATPHATAQSTRDSSSQYPYGLDVNFNPSMTVIIVVLVCAFFIVGFLSIYIRQCAENRAEGRSRHSASTAGGLSRLSVRGLDPFVVESFPVFIYSAVKDLKLGKGALECAVCISEFEDDDTLRLLPKCDHVFHPECIDAWLASHTTCPVCRANLTPSSGEVASNTTQSTELDNEFNEQNSRSELSEVLNQVSIGVDEDRNGDSQVLENLNPKQNQNRPVSNKFPRSHSTGHSLVQLGENCERYTLRLPEEVRKQILDQNLKRTMSCIVALPRDGSSRRPYRSSGGRQVGRSDRWVFTMTPPFLTRTGSVRSPKGAMTEM